MLRIGLNKTDAVIFDYGAYGWPPRFLDPGVTPPSEIEIGAFVEDFDQIEPGRVAELKFLEAHQNPFGFEIGPIRYTDPPYRFMNGTPHIPSLEAARPGLKIIAQVGIERIRDKSKRQTARLIEVRQFLPDRMRAGGPIHGIGCGIVGDEESQVVIHFGKRRIDDLRGHEVREHFLHPDIIEPLHGDEIAEPHVRRLMRDRVGPVEQLILGCRFIQQ